MDLTIKCPYCEASFKSEQDVEGMGSGQTDHVIENCSTCNKPFVVVLTLTVSWQSLKIEQREHE